MDLDVRGTATDPSVDDKPYTKEEAMEIRRQRLYQVEPPPATIEGWEKQLDRDKQVYGTHFKNDDEATLFCMLPLNHDQRLELLQTLRNERNKQKLEDELATQPLKCES